MELRAAFRTLRATPQITLVSVLLLALGVGANTVLFSLADAVMLRPFPFADQDQLVIGAENLTGPRSEVSYANFNDWRARARTFNGLAAIGSSNWTMTLQAADPITVPFRAVSHEFFDVLGTRAALGRTFAAGDDMRGAPRVVVISYGFWQRQFGGDRGVIGRPVVLNERPFTIVGVMPRGFAYPAGADAWAPVVPVLADVRTPNLPDFLADRGTAVLHVVGRLAPGVNLGQARSDLDRVIRELAMETGRTGRVGSQLSPLVDDLLGAVRIGLWALLAAVGLLLVAATANVAGLILVQLARRRRELAIRMALGASRHAIARQLLYESAIVVLAATVVAVIIAQASLPVVASLLAPVMPRVDEAAVDMRVLAFAAALGAATVLMCWIVPALSIGRVGFDAVLRSAGRAVASGGFSRPARRWLVAMEMAIAVVILSGAGLLYRSVSRLGHLDLGFNADRLLAVDIGLPPSLELATHEDVRRFYTRAIDAVAGLPFVQSVAAVGGRPLKGPIGLDSSWQIEGQTPDIAERNPWVNLETVTPAYFLTMGTPLVEGRGFDNHDRADGAPVVIVNEKLARWAWPGTSAIGKRIRAAGLDVDRSPAPWWTVIGVAANVRYREIGAVPLDVYVAFDQSMFSAGDLVIRTTAPPASVASAVRARLRQVSADGIIDVAVMDRVVAAEEAPWRANLTFFAFFAGLTVLLAAVGLFALLASSVAEQSREIGVRLALGAGASRIVGEVLIDGARIALPGALAGVAATLVTGRFVRALLFEVSPVDALTLITVPIALLAVATAACAIPAIRAARVDPAICLRAE